MVSCHPLPLILTKIMDKALLVPHFLSLSLNKRLKPVSCSLRICLLSVELLQLTAMRVKFGPSFTRSDLGILYLGDSLRVLTAVSSCLTLMLVLDGFVVLRNLGIRSLSFLIDASLLALQQRQ